MKSVDMKNYAEGQVAFWTKQISFNKGRIEWTNRQLERTRKEDRDQKAFAQTYNNGEYAHLYEGRYQGAETKKLLNERRRWQRNLKNAEKELAQYQQMVADNTEDEDIEEEETMITKTEAIKAMDNDAEDPSVTLDEFIAKAQEIDNMKEEDTMDQTIELTNTRTFEREGGWSAVTITKLHKRPLTDNWELIDDDFVTWYRKPQWDEGDKLAFYIPDSVKIQRILMTEQELNDMINNTKEETTMKTATTTTLNLTDGTVRFEYNGITYKYNTESKRYAKTTPDGKTTRIGKAEYDTNWASYEQEILDSQPSRVEINSDLHEPAIINQYGCVDCSKCNVTGCVHRDCMRRNPRSEGGLGECPRLDVAPIVIDEGVVDTELQEIINDTGLEPADAELERNIRKEKKAKKASKPRRSKDIAYEGNGVTLTAKQVDFLRELVETDIWDGFDTMIWTDVLCDQIGGQFTEKPMTVGAMISTLCEKGLAERSKGEYTDSVTNRTRKSTYMAFTGMGQKVAEELGLA